MNDPVPHEVIEPPAIVVQSNPQRQQMIAAIITAHQRHHATVEEFAAALAAEIDAAFGWLPVACLFEAANPQPGQQSQLFHLAWDGSNGAQPGVSIGVCKIGVGGRHMWAQPNGQLFPQAPTHYRPLEPPPVAQPMVPRRSSKIILPGH